MGTKQAYLGIKLLRQMEQLAYLFRWAVTGSDLCLSAAGPNHFPGAWTRVPGQTDPEATLCMKPGSELVPLPMHGGQTGSKVSKASKAEPHTKFST